MIEQGNRTQQLIYRTSYRKHRERLADIRHNITANDFLPPKNHHSAKKQLPKDKLKKQEIQSGNVYLKNKINSIKNRTNGRLDDLLVSQPLRKEPRRYFDQSNDVKMQIDSEMNNGDHITFVLPTQKTPSASFNVKIKDNQKVESIGAQTKMNSIEKSYKKFTSTSVLKDSQRDAKTVKEKQLLYNLPQRNQNRVVVYNKTLVISSMQSCLLELSLINERLLIAAYLMGLENTTLRQLFSLKRTNQLLKQCNNNYEELCSRIYIEKANDKYQYVKLMPKEEESKQKQENQEDKHKQRAKIQNEFIKRNYYTLVKTDQEQKEQPKQKTPIYSFDHVQAIVQRLAVPKRFFKLRDEKTDRNQKAKAVSNYEKESKSYQLSHEKLTQPEKIQSIDNKQSQNSLNKVKQSTISHKQSNKKKSTQKIQANKSNASVKKINKVEPNYEELYEQQFDDPSEIKNSKLHSLQKSKPINNSLVSNKSKQVKVMKESNVISNNNVSEVYNNEFQNQPEEEYEEQFQNNNESHSPVAKIANNSSLPAQNVEQQYQDEFAD